MKTFFLILLATLPWVLSAQTAEIIDQSTALFEQGNHRGALSVINKGIEQYPDSGDLYLHRGDIHYALEDLENAWRDYTSAVEKDETHPMYRIHRGVLLTSAGIYDGALADFQVALSEAGSDIVLKAVHLNRSTTYQLVRRFDLAYDDLIAAYHIDSTDIGVVNNLGTLLDELNRQEEALFYLNKVIELDSTFLGGYANLAFQYGKLGRFEEALEMSNKAIELAPKEGILYNNRGYIYYSMGQYKDAMKDIEKSMDLYPTNSYAFRNRALVYIALNKTSKACDDLQHAIDLDFTTNYGSECEELQRKHCH